MSELRGGVGDFDYPTPDPRGHCEISEPPHPNSAFRRGASGDAYSALEPVANTGSESEDIDAKLLADPLVATG
ncbi:hypothetical protein ACFROC_25570 [Nocardia tengchongensis]|uniref:hypothetical protein n=1 Tax=Nocardia tengchongensis TaxID=2055889 RepID=UPI0036811E84